MKSLEQNYDKHLVVTVIVLIALPILLGLSDFILTAYDYQITTFFYERNVEDPVLGLELANRFKQALHILQYVIFAVMLILYPIYPIIFSIEKHFNKRNPKSAIREYHILKKITYALLPLFFFAVALTISLRIIPDTNVNPIDNLISQSIRDPILIQLFISTLGSVIFLIASTLLRIILLNSSKDFKFFLARLSFRAMKTVQDDVERVKYLIEGLSSYNKYIRRNLGLQFNDLKIIYSKLILDSNLNRIGSMKELSQAFEDNDKLKSIRCLTALLNVEDTEHFLVKEPLGKKLENWGSILGTLVSMIAAVIGALATLGIPGLN
jgi:hypothetical protein